MTIPAGLSLDEWWTAHEWNQDDTAMTTTYVLGDFDEPREFNSPYGLDWAERDEWVHYPAGEVGTGT